MDPTDLGPGAVTWLGGSATFVLGGLLWLRKFLSKDAADRAMDNADIGTVRRLNELLDSERTARDKALGDVGKKLGFGEQKTRQL